MDSTWTSMKAEINRRSFIRDGLNPPPCSIIGPTQTKNVAMGAVNFLTAMGLFKGQSPAFFELLHDLAEDADNARRGQ